MNYRSAKKLKKDDKIFEKTTDTEFTVLETDKFKHLGKNFIMIGAVDHNNNFKRFTHLEVDVEKNENKMR